MQIAAPTFRRAGIVAVAVSAVFAAFAPTASAIEFFPEKGQSAGAELSTNMITAMFIIATLAFVGILYLVIAGLRTESEGIVDRSGGEAKAAGVVLFVLLAIVGAYGFLSTASPDPATAKLGVQGLTPVDTTDPTSPSAALANPNKVDPPEGDYLRVYANAQQYVWRYSYLVDGQPVYTYHELVVPAGIPVLMDVTSSDVTHSWWVPQIGGKVDAVPGYVNQTWFKVDKPGVYKGASVGISGVNYPAEATVVRVVEPKEFGVWLAKQKAGIAEAFAGLTKYRLQQQLKDDMRAKASAATEGGAE